MQDFLRPLLLVLGSLVSGASWAAPHAALLEIDGPIGPATSGYYQKAQAQAVEAGASIVVLRIDTPGGLDSAMRDIIKSILASPIPVACWVGPDGARAASAGTYIMYACHVAAMAPATNLGAATPVPVAGSWPGGKDDPLSGKEDKGKDESDGRKDKGDERSAKSAPKDDKPGPAPTDAMQRKVLNDAVAFIRGLASKRGRNATWAEAAVREGSSLSAAEALKENVIDLVAADVPDLLKKIDGRKVAAGGGSEIPLATAGLTVEKIEPDWRMQVLAVITNPTVAYILMLVGIYGLLLEGYHPGAILPGVTGAICLLLALYAFQVLPVSYVGLGLILLGVVLMIAEALAPSFGALGFGGVAAFVMGSIMLMDIDVPGYGVNMGIITGIALSAAAILATTLFLLWRARQAPVVTGEHLMVGQVAEMLEPVQSEGWARVAGERWRVRTKEPLQAGERARVTRVTGLTLYVDKEQT